MTWLLLAIICYALFALNALGDKYLLSDTSLKNPLTYAFFIGLAGALVVLAVPFLGFPAPTSIIPLLLSIASGISFVLALLPFFAGLKKFQATSIVPTVGAMQPIFALALGAIFSGELVLTPSILIVLPLLIIGGVIVTAGKHGRVSLEAFGFGMFSGFLFALSFVLAKQAYLSESLWYGLFWSRTGGLLVAIVVFFSFTEVRKEIFFRSSSSKHMSISKSGTGIVFVTTQAIGALAGILQQAAIYAAPVSGVAIVNALQGTQYVFIFILSYLASKKFPNSFKDHYASDDTAYKITGIIMILVGIFVLIYI